MEEQSVQRATKLTTLAKETSFTTQELQFVDAFGSLRSCVRAIDSAVRFGRIDTAPVVSLTVASSGALKQRKEMSARWHWACPLWDTEDAAQADARACEATNSPTRAWPLRRGSAHKHLASHAGVYGACRDYGAAPSRDNCWFLFALAHILAAIKLCVAITLSRSTTSAEHPAGLAVASPPQAPAPSSVLLPLPSRFLLLSTFGRWLVARPLRRALRPAFRPLPRS